MALMALLMVRSSNVGGGFVLNAELNIREAMEKFFVWRPRFKEFLFGHPLLMGGLYLYFKGGKGSVLSKIMIIGGITGISSVLNSFMHIHTPLAGSIIRSFFGWVMAVIPAAVIIFFTEKWLIREK